MELDKFHILKRDASLIGQETAAPRVDHGVGGSEIDSAIPSCGEDDRFRSDRDDPPFKKMEGKNPFTSSLLHNQGEDVPFFVNRNLEPRHLLVENMEEVVTCSVGSMS